MAILALDREIELVVTWVCQWHCEYCSVDTHQRPTLPWEDVVAKLQQIPADYTVTLSGGEVGTMKRQQILYILDTIEERGSYPALNTNGLFIKRYPDLLPRFTNILYHCSEDLNPDDDIILDPIPNLEYLLIITDNNYHRLAAFLNKYPDIRFNLVAATNPQGINNVELSPRLKHQMLAKYHHRMPRDSIRRIFTEKDFNRITYL